jgi:hypothetical protein
VPREIKAVELEKITRTMVEEVEKNLGAAGLVQLPTAAWADELLTAQTILIDEIDEGFISFHEALCVNSIQGTNEDSEADNESGFS